MCLAVVCNCYTSDANLRRWTSSMFSWKDSSFIVRSLMKSILCSRHRMHLWFSHYISLKVCFGKKINVKETLNERKDKKGNLMEFAFRERLSIGFPRDARCILIGSNCTVWSSLRKHNLKILKQKTESRESRESREWIWHDIVVIRSGMYF